MQEIVGRVRQHVAPACSFVTEYLNLLAEDVGLGGLSVYFGDTELRQDPVDKPTKDMTPDELAVLAECTKMRILRMRRFCDMLRQHPEGFRRCWNCDVRAIRRAARTKRTVVYQCHSGLTDIVAPIIVRGEYAGRIVTGQLLRAGRPGNDFAEVWECAKDIGPLDKDQLKEAYGELAVVAEPELRRIVKVLEQAAGSLGNLWENITVLFEQEKQLLHMHVYLQREFAEWLVNGQNFSETEARARARSLGMDSLPTVVVVAQPDLTSEATFAMDSVERQRVFGVLLEAMHSIGGAQPNSLVTSVRPEELLMLWHEPETRNPRLRNLSIGELLERIRAKAQESTNVPMRFGFNVNKYPAERMREAYRAARAALHSGPKVPACSAEDTEDRAEWLAELRQELAPRLSELKQAVTLDNGRAVSRIFEKMLNTVARCPEHDRDLRRLLFTEMVWRFLDALQETHVCDDRVEEIRLDCMRSFSGFVSMDDISDWFRHRLGNMVLHIEQMRRSPEEAAIAQACSIVQEKLNGRLSRSEVARDVGMSESHFGAVFRQQMRVSFREYVQVARMVQAQRLLLEPGKCVSEVAADVGYADVSSFTRAFTKVCGGPPSDYRDSPRSFKTVTLPRGLSL